MMERQAGDKERWTVLCSMPLSLVFGASSTTYSQLKQGPMKGMKGIKEGTEKWPLTLSLLSHLFLPAKGLVWSWGQETPGRVAEEKWGLTCAQKFEIITLNVCLRIQVFQSKACLPGPALGH